MISMFAALRRLASRSPHNFQHAVLVEKGGAVIAVGYNTGGRHAEVEALNKLWPSKRSGTRILSVRFTRTGKLAMAKPCRKCQAYLLQNGIKKVTYSNSAGSLEVMKL